MGNILFKPKTHFTMVANKLLYATNLSLKGKGMYAYLISKPERWSFSTTRIAKEMKEGRDALNNIMIELEQVNLLSRRKIKDGSKWSGVAYYISDVQDSNIVTEYYRDTKEVTKKSLEERKKTFRERCLKVYETKEMSAELAKEFFEYWTEVSYGGSTMRFEKQDVFDISRRMNTLITVAKKNGNKFNSKTKKELETKNT